MIIQEDQTLAFQPIYEGYLPWFAKLFEVYLLGLLVWFPVRAIRFGWSVWKLRKLQRTEGADSSNLHLLRTKCFTKAHSLRGVAKFTFLLSILDLSWWTADIFRSVRVEKTPGLAYILQAVADALSHFSIGILFCTALYLCAALGERALNSVSPHSQFEIYQSKRS